MVITMEKDARPGQYLVFRLDQQQYALKLPAVERVIHIVEITPLPKAPEIVLGVINYYGQIIPIVNIRSLFRLPEKEPDLSDQLIIARTSKRQIALLVDTVTGVMESPIAEIIAADRILHGLDYIEGVVEVGDGLILIHNLDTFLSLEEDKTIEVALKENTNDQH
jgi:purine-binding chemotaxis protein CheW